MKHTTKIGVRRFATAEPGRLSQCTMNCDLLILVYQNFQEIWVSLRSWKTQFPTGFAWQNCLNTSNLVIPCLNNQRKKAPQLCYCDGFTHHFRFIVSFRFIMTWRFVQYVKPWKLLPKTLIYRMLVFLRQKPLAKLNFSLVIKLGSNKVFFFNKKRIHL